MEQYYSTSAGNYPLLEILQKVNTKVIAGAKII
jgi:hypothetical protein